MPAATNVGGPKAIVLTDEERDSGVMSDMKLYEAIEAFFRDGLVVIENAIDTAIIDKLNERMLQDTKKLLSGTGEVHFKQVILSFSFQCPETNGNQPFECKRCLQRRSCRRKPITSPTLRKRFTYPTSTKLLSTHN
jgi:hypothetical protein